MLVIKMVDFVVCAHKYILRVLFKEIVNFWTLFVAVSK